MCTQCFSREESTSPKTTGRSHLFIWFSGLEHIHSSSSSSQLHWGGGRWAGIIATLIFVKASDRNFCLYRSSQSVAAFKAMNLMDCYPESSTTWGGRGGAFIRRELGVSEVASSAKKLITLTVMLINISYLFIFHTPLLHIRSAFLYVFT